MILNISPAALYEFTKQPGSIICLIQLKPKTQEQSIFLRI